MFYVDSLVCTALEREQVDDRPALEELVAGGLDAVITTVGFWEDATESMDKLVKWFHMAEDNSDLVEIAYTAADIRRIAATGRTALILGFQNMAFLQGRLGYVELFARMGTRVGQLTYNIQNEIGGSCYETNDSGLSRFGRYVVGEMNRCGMLIDLSHVGTQTSLDAIRHSHDPLAITHANPYTLAPHARNKPDIVLDALMDNGGVIGLSVYRNIVGDYTSAEKWSEMVAWTVDRIGVEHVGIGTDFDQAPGLDNVVWMRQGRWSREEQFGAGSKDSPGRAEKLEWFSSPSDFPNAENALRNRGFSDEEVALICGGNWLRLFERTFVK